MTQDSKLNIETIKQDIAEFAKIINDDLKGALRECIMALTLVTASFNHRVDKFVENIEEKLKVLVPEVEQDVSNFKSSVVEEFGKAKEFLESSFTSCVKEVISQVTETITPATTEVTHELEKDDVVSTVSSATTDTEVAPVVEASKDIVSETSVPVETTPTQTLANTEESTTPAVETESENAPTVESHVELDAAETEEPVVETKPTETASPVEAKLENSI